MLALVLAPALVLAAEDDDHSGPTVDLDLTAFYDSNVTLAELDDDIDDDAGVEATGTMTWSGEGLRGKSVAWNINATGAKFDKFDELDRVELGAGVTYNVQFARGFYAPVYEFALNGKVIDTVSEIRDGWQVDLRAMVTRRFTERLVGRLGLNLTRRESNDFKVFDNSRANLFVNSDLRTSRQSVLYGTYILSYGDVVSTAVPTLEIVEAAEEIEPDDAFGGVSSNRFAYRLEAVTHIVTLGWNRSIAPNRSLDLSVQGLSAHAEGDIDYQRTQVRLGYLHRF